MLSDVERDRGAAIANQLYVFDLQLGHLQKRNSLMRCPLRRRRSRIRPVRLRVIEDKGAIVEHGDTWVTRLRGVGLPFALFREESVPAASM